MRALEKEYARTEREVRRFVLSTIVHMGVPLGIDDVNRVVDSLLPVILTQRARLTAREKEALAKQFPELALPEFPVWYPRDAAVKMVARAAEITPAAGAPAGLSSTVTALSGKSTPEQLEDRYAKRVAAGAARHSKAASRDYVVQTARLNRVQWARQLDSGACEFCALLASRGAVYTEESVDFPAHDHCNCTATIAVHGRYDGDREAEEIRRMWLKSGNLGDFRKDWRNDED